MLCVCVCDGRDDLVRGGDDLDAILSQKIIKNMSIFLDVQGLVVFTRQIY